jgi:mannan endo-1,4-beta-mannosidase
MQRQSREAVGAAHIVGGLVAGCALLVVAACASAPRSTSSAHATADAQATPETRALLTNLRRLSGEAVLFGHESDLAYGFTWRNEPGRSDVKESGGSYPAVYGWDVNTLFARGPTAASGEPVRQLRAWIAEGYGRGGVITMEWHQDNIGSHGNAWDTTRVVAQLLPGGSLNGAYRARLDTVADFFNSLRARGKNGEETLVPVIFRPFHELSGSWFWWGKNFSSREEFVALWRFTIDYLQRDRDVHNLLYAYSTDVFDSKESYLDRYPGDDYADVLAFDDYQSIRTPATRAVFVRRMHDVAEIASARGKIAAIAETGVETVPDSTWWTGTLLPALKNDSLTRRMAYVLVWRNANLATDRKNHFYAPYAGQASAADFARFRRDGLVKFEDDLPDLYH